MTKNQIRDYNDWLKGERGKLRNIVSRSEVQEALMKDLTFVKQMDAKEYTLYRKWLEVKDNRIAMAQSEMLNREPDEIDYLPNGRPQHTYYVPGEILEDLLTYAWASRLIWTKGDIQDIHPEITVCSGNKFMTRYWNFVRTFTSAMPNNSNPGRMLRFLVSDKVTGKLYGAISLASDIRDLRPRDEFIG